MFNIPPELLLGGTAVGTPALAWIAVKFSMNGIRGDVKEVKDKLDGIDGRVRVNSEKIARMEGQHAQID